MTSGYGGAVDGLDGVLVVDKAIGPTSHDTVRAVRRLLGTRRVGHTGTLDPLATGVLPIVIGRATRLAQFLSATTKAYRATVQLGATTETDDAQGIPCPTGRPLPTKHELEVALPRFVGAMKQLPPTFSAKKVAGVRAYDLARASQSVALRPAEVEVFRLELTDWRGDTCALSLECSTGFYVRALARDLGQALGCGAYLTELQRVRSGEFSLEQAQSLDVLVTSDDPRGSVLPMSALLAWLPGAQLGPTDAERAAHGGTVAWAAVERWIPAIEAPGAAAAASPWRSAVSGPVRLTSRDGRLLGIARGATAPEAGVPLQPFVVLV